MTNRLDWFAAIFLAIQVFSTSVSAVIGCAAEAKLVTNFFLKEMLN
jgi:hypothetical protein